MGNKGRPKTARPLANFSNASPALSDAAPEGQATRRDAKTAPVLHAATLPSIPTLAEASSKGLAPATVILSPQWRDGTPAYIPPPAGAKVGSAPSLPPPEGVTELVKKNRMERKEHQEKVLDHMLRTEKREEDRAERELRAAKREEERAERELKMLAQNAQVLNQNKQVLEQVNRQAEVQAEEIKVLKELVLFMKNK